MTVDKCYHARCLLQDFEASGAGWGSAFTRGYFSMWQVWQVLMKPNQYRLAVCCIVHLLGSDRWHRCHFHCYIQYEFADLSSVSAPPPSSWPIAVVGVGVASESELNKKKINYSIATWVTTSSCYTSTAKHCSHLWCSFNSNSNIYNFISFTPCRHSLCVCMCVYMCVYMYVYRRDYYQLIQP